MVLAGSDVASGLINPALPAFIAVSVAATATSGAHRHSAAIWQTQGFLPKRQGLPTLCLRVKSATTTAVHRGLFPHIRISNGSSVR